MRFSQLHMQNFRGISELEIDFERDLTVIIGRNGAGKTSLLDALASFMELMLTSALGPNFDPVLSLQDITFGTQILSMRLQYEADRGASKSLVRDDLEVNYEGGLAYPSHLMRDVLMKLPEELRSSLNFVYYRQNRTCESDNDVRTRDPERIFLADEIRRDSLAKDLRTIADLQTWWDRRDAQEARMVRDSDPDYRDPELEAIRALVKKIDTFKGITYSSTAAPPGLYLIKNNDALVHVSRLASGERSYVVLLGDLARRLTLLAPNKPLEEISAIVLIDEIELNLHPIWQSEIAPTLTEVFKACQFVIATHSPQVLSGIESRQVRILKEQPTGKTKVAIPLSTKGRTSNYLLEGVFEASERFPAVEQLIASFDRAVDRRDVDTAKATLAALEEEIGDDAPTLLVLRKRFNDL